MIPHKMPDNCVLCFLRSFLKTQKKHLFQKSTDQLDDYQASFLGSLGMFLGDLTLSLGVKKEEKKVKGGVQNNEMGFVFSTVNM